MRKLFCFLTLLALIAISSADSYANVSSSAVLFLRIAAGARAAGMGEAFVAVADDATTTHWNPAGLGTYPLSSKWFEIKVPEHLRPLKKVALYRNESSGDAFKKYDIWALSRVGLVRYNQKEWVRGDIIEPRHDQTAETVIRNYTNLIGEENDEKIRNLLEIIGDANNPFSREKIDSLEATLMPLLSEEYDAREDIEVALIALKKAYNDCMIDWDKFEKADEYYRNAMKDSVINESEADKILFALERAKRRYIKEEVTIPFEINFEGQLYDLVSDGKLLWVVGEGGMFRYNKQRWQRFNQGGQMPASEITSIKLHKKTAFMTTEDGVMIYSTGAFDLQGPDRHGIPNKSAEAVAVAYDNDAWAVVDGDLYHYDGRYWKNYFEYQDVLGETPESLYESMKVFGTPAEYEVFLEKYERLNRSDTVLFDLGAPTVLNGVRMLVDSLGITNAYRILQDSLSRLEAARDAAPEVSEDMTEDISADVSRLQNLVDSLGMAQGLREFKSRQAREAEQAKMIPPEPEENVIGRTLLIPYLAGLDYKVTDMDVDADGNLWIGTEYGLLKFERQGRKWKRYGYRDYTVEENTTVTDLALNLIGKDQTRAERLADNIRVVNKLVSDDLEAGRVIKMYSNPAGSKINEIEIIGRKTFFATEDGLIQYTDHWEMYNAEGLGKYASYGVEHIDDNYWFVTGDKIKVWGGAQSELTIMHVNWLPELADDIYYEFFSYVQNFSGWGTVGTSVTFLNYGDITRTSSQGENLGTFSAFDIAFSLSYGTPLTQRLSGGLSAKIIYSHLSEQGAGQEKGSGTSTGLALDVGLLYKMTKRLNVGLAITNLGPDISYIDVAQSDPLPRNLAFGLAYTILETDFNKFLFTIEANKSLVGIDDFTQEAKEVILNGGAEWWYGSFIAFRGGYIYDQEGDIKTPTLGFGLAYRSFKFDFAYIPSNDDVPLANTMRFSLGANF